MKQFSGILIGITLLSALFYSCNDDSFTGVAGRKWEARELVDDTIHVYSTFDFVLDTNWHVKWRVFFSSEGDTILVERLDTPALDDTLNIPMAISRGVTYIQHDEINYTFQLAPTNRLEADTIDGQLISGGSQLLLNGVLHLEVGGFSWQNYYFYYLDGPPTGLPD